LMLSEATIVFLEFGDAALLWPKPEWG